LPAVDQIDSLLRDVVFIYGYIKSKDVFESDYQLFLATRLLTGTSSSKHAENKVIAQMKSQCGYAWTNKLEGMFRDMEYSLILSDRFKTWIESNAPEMVDMFDLAVSVCTTSFWPPPPNRGQKCSLPAVVAAKASKYIEFYSKQHSSRLLEWRLDEGRAEVKMTFQPPGKPREEWHTKTVGCTTYQMMILLCFNNMGAKKFLSWTDLIELTQVGENTLFDHLNGLCFPLKKAQDGKPIDSFSLLKKAPVGGTDMVTKDKDGKDVIAKFMINNAFTFHINKFDAFYKQTRKVGEKEAAVDPVILQQRINMTEAAVVRIMKTKRAMSHRSLVAEVMQALSARFECKPEFIKERLERLMGEYISRDESNRANYLYKA